jgi:hypothetical protein
LSKNVTRLDTFARVIRHFGKFGASGYCLAETQLKQKTNLKPKTNKTDLIFSCS